MADWWMDGDGVNHEGLRPSEIDMDFEIIHTPEMDDDPWVCPKTGSEVWCDECRDSNGHWPMKRSEWRGRSDQG